jgi:tryptophan synthase alpha chain
MSRVDSSFESSGDRMVLGTYLVAGYPDYSSSLEAIMTVVDAGADMIELGIPYSDPVADGRVLQEASGAALTGGMTPTKALELAGEARECVDVPILMMTYYNPVLQYGQETFCRRCGELDLDGMLVPDLPVEESRELLGYAKREKLSLIYFLSVNSPEERVGMTSEVANGFVYLFSVKGVTGERDHMDPALGDSIGKIKSAVGVPVSVGFGISGPDQVAMLKELGADGIIVGSGVVRRQDDGFPSVRDFVSSLKGVC